jgi:DNA gyrase subunit A
LAQRKKKTSPRKSSKAAAARQPSLFDEMEGGGGETTISLHEAAKERYLNYALSVITSRALPDVRDGLKPVQRRILFTMGQAGIRSNSKHRKCAKVVGDVMGSYHPHGDSSIYDALVRMAQPFSLRMPLVDGSGNFGSLDGDPAAAMRYTECRLSLQADALLEEIGQRTVDFRPNYDGTKSEPVVLPAQQPNLLINGSTGIAVGMATNIPPHNPVEVCNALLRLLKNRETRVSTLCAEMPGPDFPTGGQILTSAEEMVEIYRRGQGSIRVRGTVKPGPKQRGAKVYVIDSIPYGTNKAVLVERIAEVVTARKLPPLIDVRDLSTTGVSIELVMKRDADENKVLAYLYKHTPLQANFAINLTCLVPTANPEVGRPERCDLKMMLGHFLNFRMEVVTRRLENELEGLEKRIHVLEGFVTVFDALDRILKIIRASDGKADAAKKIMKEFPLDEEQTDAILELKLYRLARLEINVIREELDKKRQRAAEINKLLGDEGGRWEMVTGEIRALRDAYKKNPECNRRTLLEAEADEVEFNAEDFIVAEDAVVLVTRDGWVKRQREVKDLAKTKIREGDAILAAEPGSTRCSIVFFSSFGTAYTARIADIPATTGYGEPIQKRFKLKDGEKIVAAYSLDPRRIGKKIGGPEDDVEPEVVAFEATDDGYALRFSFAPFAEPSNRNGRKYARPRAGAHVVGVTRLTGGEIILAASRNARAMVCAASDVNFLFGPGRGVLLIKLARDDELLGFHASRGDRDLLTVETNRGATKTISTAKYEVTGRGGKGRELQTSGHIVGIQYPPVEPPEALRG